MGISLSAGESKLNQNIFFSLNQPISTDLILQFDSHTQLNLSQFQGEQNQFSPLVHEIPKGRRIDQLSNY